MEGREQLVHVWIEGFVGECEDEIVNDVNFCFISHKLTKESTYKPTKEDTYQLTKEITYKPTKESNVVKLI